MKQPDTTVPTEPVTEQASPPPSVCSEECGGNGWIDCWECGGDGIVCVPDDDMTEIESTCMTCVGHGGFRCPVCAARDEPGSAHPEESERAT